MLLKLRHLLISIVNKEQSVSAPLTSKDWIMADRIAIVVLFSAAVAYVIFWH